MADRPPVMPGSMPSSFDENHEFYNEKPLHKVFRKIKEEPLIPLGIGLTTAAFINAYLALRRGDSKQANRMFRARVGAQAFTVVAMVAGSMYYSKDREKTAELRKLKEQRDAEEKRLKWIRELEVRDQEEQAIKATLQQKIRATEADLAHGVEATATTPTTPENKEGGGSGILGRMGLWPSSGENSKPTDDVTTTVTDVADETAEKRSKRENPKSSLGAIGEIMASQKKDSDGKKPN